MKRVTRKGRHVRFGQIPFRAAFSGRRAQSPAVAVTGQFTPSWLSHGAPSMPPRKRAQGFDVALYRRGAGRLVGAEVDFAASRTPSCHVPPPQKTSMLQRISYRAAGTANKKASSPSGGGSWHVVPDGRGNCKALGTVVFCPSTTHPPTPHPSPTNRGRPRRAVGSRRRPSKRRGEGKGPFPFKPRNCCPSMSAGDPPKGGSNVQPSKRRGEGKGPFPFKPRNCCPSMSAGDPPKGGSNVRTCNHS